MDPTMKQLVKTMVDQEVTKVMDQIEWERLPDKERLPQNTVRVFLTKMMINASKKAISNHRVPLGEARQYLAAVLPAMGEGFLNEVQADYVPA